VISVLMASMIVSFIARTFYCETGSYVMLENGRNRAQPKFVRWFSMDLALDRVR
jgi:hypothetical protein